eukprot:Blabericola_migrator_1__6239@NODE_314_length_10020_cov_127_741485_g257_i0_p1_GENE_NODE_314_length_10020_cov_127_741485_g257_i0NODE_314_length_10020_cov_127_741485_g257_i0_p1_ORF_typecomplete_len514_score73_00SSF/PF00474_17/2_2e03SSF/PF00474_17/7e41Spore_permease/PF03845_13/9_2e02Spore_permease/PF03845_13/0_00013Spore_permease/PF03845_13/1_6e04Spore_permease/PF03845_13/2_1e03Colicin/PF01024_19/2_1Colicin/PF01024_19/2_8e03_NODE_314_length_10020_cov_127_741485_g257_i019743515
MLTVWGVALILYLSLVLFVAVVLIGAFTEFQQALRPDRKLVSAYKSQPWWSLACSFFAAAFGASALSANPEAGATASWMSVVAYGLANALPYWILIYIGPQLQNFLKMEGFTVADFVLQRYGRPMHLLTCLLSVFFMFIWLSAELTSLSDSFKILAPGFSPVVAMVSIVLVTASYALFAGFKASILTDRLQAPMAVLIVVILLAGILSYVDAPREAWKAANRFDATTDITSSLVLILSTTINQFLDLGSWQRVFSSVSVKDAKLGLLAAGSVNFLMQSSMTAMGVFAVAAATAGQIDLPEGEEFMGFYLLLTICPTFFTAITLILAIVLSSSTIDSLQNSLAAALAGDLLRSKHSLHWARLFSVMFIIPAVILATYNKSVLTLFLLSNIFSAAIIPPIFLGLSARFATPHSALGGTASGILLIFIIGWSMERSFVGGLKWPIFPRGLSHWSTLMTFLLVPITSALVTIGIAQEELRRSPAMLELQEELLQALDGDEVGLVSPRNVRAELARFV